MDQEVVTACSQNGPEDLTKAELIREGNLQELQKNTKTWEMRYAVLVGTKLQLYRNKEDHECTCEISLQMAKIDSEPVSANGEEFTFTIQPVDGSHISLSSKSEQDIEDWISVVNQQSKCGPILQGSSVSHKTKLPCQSQDGKAIHLEDQNQQTELPQDQSIGSNRPSNNELYTMISDVQVKVNAIYGFLKQTNSNFPTIVGKIDSYDTQTNKGCTTFVPDFWKPNRCNNCFHDRKEHANAARNKKSKKASKTKSKTEKVIQKSSLNKQDTLAQPKECIERSDDQVEERKEQNQSQELASPQLVLKKEEEKIEPAKEMETEKVVLSEQKIQSSEQNEFIEELRSQHALLKEQLLLQAKLIEQQQGLLKQHREQMQQMLKERIPSLPPRPEKSTSHSKGRSYSDSQAIPARVPLVRKNTKSSGLLKGILIENTHKLQQSKPSTPKAVERTTTREKVMSEIFESEKGYVRYLEILVEEFADKLGKKILSTEQIKGIFANVKTLLELHKQILKDLEQTQNIPKTFTKYSPFLKCYTDYVNNYDQCLSHMSRLKDHKKFQAFLSEARANPKTKGLDLMSYLIMPIQRIPRYRLLLGELKKQTAADDEGMVDLDTALEKIKEIAAHVNKKKHEVEAQHKVLTIQNQLTGTKLTLVKPGRHLVYEFHTLYSKKNKTYSLFLFTDIVLWCSSTKKFKGMLNLTSLVYKSVQEEQGRGFTLTQKNTQEVLKFFYKDDNNILPGLEKLEKTIQDAKTRRQKMRSQRTRGHKSRSDLQKKLAMSASLSLRNMSLSNISIPTEDEEDMLKRKKKGSVSNSHSRESSILTTEPIEKEYSMSRTWIDGEHGRRRSLDDDEDLLHFHQDYEITNLERKGTLQKLLDKDGSIGRSKTLPPEILQSALARSEELSSTPRSGSKSIVPDKPLSLRERRRQALARSKTVRRKGNQTPIT